MEETLFDQELARLRDRMYRFARSLLGDAVEAEDATHDTFERLWRRRDEVARWRSVEAFALTALRNGCIDRLRRRHETHAALREEWVAPQDAVEWWSNKELVRAAMARLPLRQREVLHLKEIEGYTTHEIAELIDTEENQVRTILSRARQHLRAAVEELMLNR